MGCCRGDEALIGCGGGGVGSGRRSIFVGGFRSLVGKSIFALITRASSATCALMMNNIACGLDGRSATRRRPAAYSSISNLLSQAGSSQFFYVTTLHNGGKEELLRYRSVRN